MRCNGPIAVDYAIHMDIMRTHVSYRRDFLGFGMLGGIDFDPAYPGAPPMKPAVEQIYLAEKFVDEISKERFANGNYRGTTRFLSSRHASICSPVS